jgi:hypothetical protein
LKTSRITGNWWWLLRVPLHRDPLVSLVDVAKIWIQVDFEFSLIQSSQIDRSFGLGLGLWSWLSRVLII